MLPNSMRVDPARVNRMMQECLAGQIKSSGGSTSEAWEPQAKQYSNMNLKDQLAKQRKQKKEQEDDESEVGGELTEAEREKKSKLAKKRSEKRKKQKEKDRKAREDNFNETREISNDFLNYSELSVEEQERYVVVT